MGNVDDTKSGSQSPCRADEVVPYVRDSHDRILTGQFLHRDRQDIGGDKLIQCGTKPGRQFVKGSFLTGYGGHGRGIADASPRGIGCLDIVGDTFPDGLIVAQAVGQSEKLRRGVLPGRIADAGVHGLAHFLIDPCDRPVGRTGNEPAVLVGNVLEVLQLFLELALSCIVLKFGKDGGVDLIGGSVQGGRVDVRSGSRRIGEFLCDRRQRRYCRADSVYLTSAERIAFVHAVHGNLACITVELEAI